MISADDTASDAGTDATETSGKKKKKMFSSIKKMFSSNNLSANKASDINENEDLENIEYENESRMSEASAGIADQGESTGGTPKKKKSKIFSTKMITKMFRSNSLTSNGPPEATDGDLGASSGDMGTPMKAAGDIGAEDSPAQTQSKTKRKSFLSKVRKSFSGDSSKSTATPSQGSPVPEQPVAVASPSHSNLDQQSNIHTPVLHNSGEGDDDEEEEEVVPVDTTFTSKQSFFEDKASTPSVATSTTPFSEKRRTASPTPARQQAAPTSNSGSSIGKKLFEAVEDEVPAPVASPHRLEYDLPMHSPAHFTHGGRLKNDVTGQ